MSNEALDRARDSRRLVADAFEVGDRLGDRDQQPQVARRRLAARDDGRQVAVDLDFHLIDPDLLAQHLCRRVAAELAERVDGLGHLGLDQAAHFEHAIGDAAEFVVELG